MRYSYTSDPVAICALSELLFVTKQIFGSMAGVDDASNSIRNYLNVVQMTMVQVYFYMCLLLVWGKF